jgi:hypothetical protein
MANSIGRLFVEINADTRGLIDGLNNCVKALGELPAKSQSAIDGLSAGLEKALNPTIRLEQQLLKLGQAGKDTADYIQVNWERIIKAAETAQSAGKSWGEPFAKALEASKGLEKAALDVKALADAEKALAEQQQKLATENQRLVQSFEQASNPAKKLYDDIRALQAAGKSNTDIWAVYGRQITESVQASRAQGQAIPKAIEQLYEFGNAGKSAGTSMEALGNKILEFAKNPLEATKAGLVSVLEYLGPTAVGIGAIATAAVTAAVATANLAEHLSEGAIELRNHALAAGMTAQEYQALQRVGVETGVGMDSLARMLGMLDRQMATGAKMDFVKVLNALRMEAGEGAADISKGIVSVLDDLGKRLAAIKDPGEKAELINAAFNRRLQEMGILAVVTGGHLKDLQGVMIKQGATYDKQTQANLENTWKGITLVGRAWQEAQIWATKYFATATSLWSDWIQGKKSEPLTLGMQQPMFVAATGTEGKEPIALREQSRGLELAKLLHDRITENRDLLIQLAEADVAYNKAVDAGDVANAQKWGAEYGRINKILEAFKEAPKLIEKISTLGAEEAKILADVYEKARWATVNRGDNEAAATGKRFGEQTKKFLEEQAAIQKTIDRDVLQSKIEVLKIEQQIADTAIPMNDREREMIAIRKISSDTELKKQETILKFTQMEAELRERIATNITRPDIQSQLTKDLEALPERLKAELSALDQLGMAEIAKAHKQEYLRIVDTIRDGAGKVFDAMVARGKNAFQSLTDWVEGIFLTRLRKIFENLVTMIFASNGSGGGGMLQQLFQGVLPRMAAGFTGAGAGAAFGGAGDVNTLMSRLGVNGGPLTIGQIQILSKLSSYGTGASSAGWGMAGLGTLGMIGGGAGFGAGMLMPGPAWLKAGTGIGAGLLGGAGAITAGLIPGLGAASFGSALSFMGSGAGIFGSAGLFGMGAATIPVLGGLIVAGLLGAKFAQGKNAYEAGGMESLRDLGVGLSSKDMKTFLQSKGISESTAYGIRKDIESSPAFLTQLGGIAKQQGTYDTFLKKLETVSTAWGTFNFRKAYEIGDLTGDWSELDKAFEAAFSSSQALQKNLPNWKEILTIGGDAAKKAAADFEDLWKTFQESGEMSQEFADFLTTTAASLDEAAKSSTAFAEQLDQARASAAKWTELKPVIDGLSGLKSALEQISDTTEKTIYQSFLDTGKISDELRQKIKDLGGDIAVFEKLSGLVSLRNEFDELKQTFLDTGEILPRLRELFVQFGADLAVLDDAARLPGLMAGLKSIESLRSSIQGLMANPIADILAGKWTAATYEALSQLKIDPLKLTGLADLSRFENEWDKALSDFYSGTKKKWDAQQKKYVDVPMGLVKGGVLEQAISKYGGEEGKNALLNYARGINTITPELLAKVKAATDKDFQATLKSSLDYLATVAKDTTTEINSLTTAVNSQFEKIYTVLSTDVQAAAKAVVANLSEMLERLKDIVKNTSPAIPSAQNAGSGGENTGTETGSQESNTSSGTVINVYVENAYGLDDLDTKVAQSITRTMRRGGLLNLVSSRGRA